MGFYVVEGSPKPIWVPIDYTSGAVTLYIGQIVYGGMATTPVPSLSGVTFMGAASGTADTSQKYIPFGVVSGLATRSGRTYSSTYLTEYDASVITQAALAARENIGVEGMIVKSDPIAAVQITRIMGTSTVLKGPIFQGALGTAPTLITATTGSTDGLSFIGVTSGWSPVAFNATSYCRTGANAGIYRVHYDTSTTTRTFLIPYPYDIAIGDTFVCANMKVGTCFMQLDALGMYLDTTATLTSYYIVNCWEMDLKEAGKENATFSFTGDHFCSYRA